MSQIERLRKKLKTAAKQQKHGIKNKYSATGYSGGTRKAISFTLDSAYELLDEIDLLYRYIDDLKKRNA
jgi:hypothetical protein